MIKRKIKTMKNKAIYTCPYCGNKYLAPSGLAHCILQCEERKKNEEAEQKQTKLDAEKATRWAEIESQRQVVRSEKEKLSQLYEAYYNDYPLTVTESIYYYNDTDTPYLHHYFF